MLSHLPLRITFALFAATNCIGAAGQTMYRCGNTFSQQPCGPDAKSTPVPVPAMGIIGSGYVESPELRKLRIDMENARKDLDRAVAHHCAGKKIDALTVGMSEADMSCIQKYREPNKVNVTTSAGEVSKQFVFKDHGRTTYVYFTNGKLKTIQNEQ